MAKKETPKQTRLRALKHHRALHARATLEADRAKGTVITIMVLQKGKVSALACILTGWAERDEDLVRTLGNSALYHAQQRKALPRA